jgi:hypothetical protein
MIVAHETMHTVQTLAYGNPEDQSTSLGSWFTALSKIQREGTARYVEYDTDSGPYHPVSYGFVERAIDTERLRAFPEDIALLGPLYDSCYPTFDHDRFADVYTNGMNTGGPYYDVGQGIAQAIDQRMGRAAFLATVSGGPKVFYGDYVALEQKDPTLPQLPPEVAAAIPSVPDRINLAGPPSASSPQP